MTGLTRCAALHSRADRIQDVARPAAREYVETHSRAELLDQELMRYAEALEMSVGVIYMTCADLSYEAKGRRGSGCARRRSARDSCGMARATVFGQDAYPTLEHKAAALRHSIAGNRASMVGQRRLALGGLIAFHDVNGCRLTPTNEQAHDLIVAISTGELRRSRNRRPHPRRHEWLASTTCSPCRSPNEDMTLTPLALIAVFGCVRAIEGAPASSRSFKPLWTMLEHLAQSGPLTSSVPRLVDVARQSVTCSTFNFQRLSGLRDALGRAAACPEIEPRVYADTNAADHDPKRRSPTTTEVAEHYRPGAPLRTKSLDRGYVPDRAKFHEIDHRVLVTGANFSSSAGRGKVEFGVVIDSQNVSEAVEHELCEAEDSIYERVTTQAGSSR
jgi:prophage maintenance system killer protein